MMMMMIMMKTGGKLTVHPIEASPLRNTPETGINGNYTKGTTKQ